MSTNLQTVRIPRSLHFKPFYEEAYARYILLRGGRGSAKSFNAVRKSIIQLLGPQYHRIAYVRYYHSLIRASIWQEFLDQVNDLGLRDMLQINEQGMRAVGPTGNILQAMGLRGTTASQTDKAKGFANFTDLYIDEADSVPEIDFMRLDDSIRTTKGRCQINLMFNTEDGEGWISQRWYRGELPFIQDGTVLYHHSTYRDNLKYLDEGFIASMERYQAENPEWYKVYGLGQWGSGKSGKIYPDWVPIEAIPENVHKRTFGLDFGFTNDPSCLVETGISSGSLYSHEHFYEKGMPTSTMGKRLKEICGSTIIYADSAHPRLISDLRAYGLNIVGAKKGKGSVERGIEFIKDHKTYVTSSSKNAWDERNYYIWKQDREGRSMNVPTPACEDHFMDAMRYSVSDLYSGVQGQSRSRAPRMGRSSKRKQ